jgi:hypothetical protein
VLHSACSGIPLPQWQWRNRDLRINSVVEDVLPKFEVTFHPDENGYPIFTKIDPLVDLRSQFLAEQAVWDIDPNFFKSTCVHTFGSADKISDFRCEQYLGDAVSPKPVYLHLLPPESLLLFADLLTPAEIHGKTNVREIVLDKLDQSLLKSFRKERSDFLRNRDEKVSRKDMIEFQSLLAKKYKALFVQ